MSAVLSRCCGRSCSGEGACERHSRPESVPPRLPRVSRRDAARCARVHALRDVAMAGADQDRGQRTPDAHDGNESEELVTLNRYAVRRDDNEDEIVSALRRCGYRVWRHDQPLDLLVYFQRIRTRGAAFGFLEVKTERGKLTAAQDQFFGDTDGAPRAVVRDALEALATIRAWAEG